MKKIKNPAMQEIKDLVIDYLNDNPTIPVCDLHNEVLNTNYFIIGRYQAEKWLAKNYGIFNAIEKIKEYENDNFGEVFTDLSEPEHICNMLVYIIGEELLQELESITDNWDENLTPELCTQIIDEIEEL